MKKPFLLIPIVVIISGTMFITYNSLHSPKEVIVHSIHVTDISDDRKLLWISSNVFVWKITKEIWSKEDKGGMPTTQFSVEIIENIKGNLSWSVTVSQEWWYKDGSLYISEWDVFYSWSTKWIISERSALMIPWEEYVMATITSENSDIYYLISHPNGKHHFWWWESKKQKQAKVNSLRKAYIDEIPFEPFVKEWRNKNAFSSLDIGEKEDYIKKTHENELRM